jgi:hypothetical protein
MIFDRFGHQNKSEAETRITTHQRRLDCKREVPPWYFGNSFYL